MNMTNRWAHSLAFSHSLIIQVFVSHSDYTGRIDSWFDTTLYAAGGSYIALS
jgi:hypothetical protein